MLMCVKTIFLYFVITLLYRIMGKKEVGELNITDFIVTILIAEFAAIGIENNKVSIFYSLLPIISLVLIQICIGYVTLKSSKIRNFIDGKPSVIIKKGKLMFSEMIKQRYNLDDLITQLREKGIKSIEEVDYAILENSGNLSIFKDEKNYPLPIILDGIVDYNVLKEINKDRKWIYNLLDKRGLKLEDIFYAFYTKDKTYIIKRSDLN